MNIREQIKKDRLRKLGDLFAQAKKESKTIDKKKTISMLIVEYGISKRTALEEFEAVNNYDY